MKLLRIVGFLAALSFSLAAAELAGAWKGSMETQMGNTGVTITIAPGDALGARWRSASSKRQCPEGGR